MSARKSHTFLFSVLFSLLAVLPASAATESANDFVHVSWSPSPSTTVVGYHVYRSAAADGPFVRTNADLVIALTYVDGNVRDGATYFYAATAVDAQGRESALADASNGVAVHLDSLAPLVLMHAPVAGQGTLQPDGAVFGRPVPAASGIYARVWDDSGVDLDTLSVVALVNGRLIDGDTTVHPVAANDTTDVFVRFAPAAQLPFGAVVHVGLNGSDVQGNGMATYNFTFLVESARDNADADAAAPEATRTLLPDGSQVLRTADATAHIPASVTQFVSFGAADVLGAAANLDQIQFYAEPVRVRLALRADEYANAANLHVLRLNEDPTIGWELATVGDGWLAGMQVADGQLELTVTHAAALAISLN